jgi:2'-5' RNA ligase
LTYIKGFGGEAPRLFVAVALPDRLRAGLHDIGRKAKGTLHFQKWTHADDLHLTLKFLGDTPAAKVDAVHTALQNVAARCGMAPFELSVDGLGVFGPPAKPTVLWAGVQGELGQLAELQRRVEEEAARLDYEPEPRAYRAHLTLARRYSGSEPFRRRELETAGELLAAAELRWQAQSFTLYRSHLGRTPMYEALAEYMLRG